MGHPGSGREVLSVDTSTGTDNSGDSRAGECNNNEHEHDDSKLRAMGCTHDRNVVRHRPAGVENRLQAGGRKHNKHGPTGSGCMGNGRRHRNQTNRRTQVRQCVYMATSTTKEIVDTKKVCGCNKKQK